MRTKNLLFLPVALLVWSCNSTTVKSTDQSPVVVQSPEQMPEDQLLDVGVGLFDPGIDGLKQDEENPRVFPEVRKAESRYMPNVLAGTLQNSGAWGVVRVVPDRQSEMDVWVDGRIIQSDGEFLKLAITVQDSSGRVWFTKNYEEEASKYSYDREVQRQKLEPFQGLYNRIANDMIAHRSQLQPADVYTLRTITELKFAQRFAPEVFADYLVTDGKGRYGIKRLPADNDPLLERLRRIRERDNLFVDTLQDYYTNFAGQMQGPYTQWRDESYKETMDLREANRSATARTVGGVLVGLAGIAAAVLAGGSSNPWVNSGGTAAAVVGVGAGTMLVKSGLDQRAEAKMHAEALKEIAASLDAEIAPHTVTLEDRTVTLTGTVEQQYAQWRQILRDIYDTETGMAPGAAQ
ncbi:MAG TPA: hypothetical protein VIC61_07335 [Gammaproteobacteria bacterium]